MDDLDIANRLHRRVLQQELDVAKARKDFWSSKYNYGPSTKTSELEPFQKISDECFLKYPRTAVLAEIFLLLDNGNLLLLGAKKLEGGKVVTEKLNFRRGLGLCSSIFQDIADHGNYYKLPFPLEMQRGLFDDQISMTLTAYLVKNEVCERQGIVCMVDRCCPEEIIDDDREDFLRRLAGDAEHQLHCRRQHFLKKGNWDASASPFETLQNRRGYRHEIVLPARGPIQAVLKSQITQRLQTQAPFQFDHNSSGYNKLPVFQHMSTEVERMHLPLDFYDSVDQIPGPRPPISKNDMEYSAVVESLALTEIKPEDAIAIHLKQMVKMATQVFAFPNCEITFMNHNTIFCLAGHAESERKSESITTMKRNKDGSRFLWTMQRAQAI